MCLSCPAALSPLLFLFYFQQFNYGGLRYNFILEFLFIIPSIVCVHVYNVSDVRVCV